MSPHLMIEREAEKSSWNRLLVQNKLNSLRSGFCSSLGLSRLSILASVCLNNSSSVWIIKNRINAGTIVSASIKAEYSLMAFFIPLAICLGNN